MPLVFQSELYQAMGMRLFARKTKHIVTNTQRISILLQGDFKEFKHLKWKTTKWYHI